MTPGRPRRDWPPQRCNALIILLVFCSAATTGVTSSPTRALDNDNKNPSFGVSHIIFKQLGEVKFRRSYSHIYLTLGIGQNIENYNKITQLLHGAERQILNSALWEDSKQRILTVLMNLEHMLSKTESKIKLACAAVHCRKAILKAIFPRHHDVRNDRATQQNTMSKRFEALLNYGDFLNNLETEENERHKRQYFMGALSLTTAGLSLFSLYQTNRLASRIDMLDTEQNKIVAFINATSRAAQSNAHHLELVRTELKQVQIVEDHLGTIASYNTLTTYIGLLITSITEEINAFLDLVINKQLSSLFVDLSDFHAALTNISRQAEQINLELTLTSISSILQFGVSYVADTKRGEGTDVTVMISVPLTSKGLTHTGYALVNYPIVIGGSVFKLKHQNDILVVQETTQQFVEMSAVEWSFCSTIHNMFMCPNAVSRKNGLNSCLSALYLQSESGVTEFCEFAPWKTTGEIMVELGENRILVRHLSKISLSLQLICGNETKHVISSSSEEIIEVPPSCELSGPNLVYKSKIPDQMVHYVRHKTLNNQVVIDMFLDRERNEEQNHTKLEWEKPVFPNWNDFASVEKGDNGQSHATAAIIIAVLVLLSISALSVLSVLYVRRLLGRQARRIQGRLRYVAPDDDRARPELDLQQRVEGEREWPKARLRALPTPSAQSPTISDGRPRSFPPPHQDGQAWVEATSDASEA